MHFNSHVERLAVVTVGLVNAVTPGRAGLDPVDAPTGDELRRRVSDVVRAPGYAGACTVAEAERLAPWIVRCRAVIELLDTGALDAAADAVNAMLEESATRPRLDRGPDGAYGVHFHGPDDSFDRGWAAGLAAGLAMAIGGDRGHRYGVCRAPGCDRVWVDLSRNAHKKFCSVRCQSRVKAAVHRSRRGDGTSG